MCIQLIGTNNIVLVMFLVNYCQFWWPKGLFLGHLTPPMCLNMLGWVLYTSFSPFPQYSKNFHPNFFLAIFRLFLGTPGPILGHPAPPTRSDWSGWVPPYQFSQFFSTILSVLIHQNPHSWCESQISVLPDHVLGGLPVDLLLQLVHQPLTWPSTYMTII